MDFDDFDQPSEPPPKPSRFAPKTSRFQPKSKADATVAAKPELKPEPPAKLGPQPQAPVVVKVEDDGHSSISAASKMDVDEEFHATELKEEDDERVNAAAEAATAMDEDVAVSDGDGDGDDEDEGDHVVAEYDVYYNPRDSITQWYVLQYPLRPSWRPYELDQQCTEVRVKPNIGEVEVELSMDINSDNYDTKSNAFGKTMTKQILSSQILSSSSRLAQGPVYAVGVLSGKKLYMNPVHAVVQLRPSMDHLDSGGSKKRNIPNVTVKEEGSSNSALAGPSRKQSKQMNPEAVESWISLKYHSSTTELAERYLRNMVTEQKDALQFSMNPYDYLNSLCPGAIINKMKSSGPSKRYLLSLPLAERIKTCLVEGPSVQRFTAIKHLAPDDPVELVLEELQKYAHLVQGLWVLKTGVRYPNIQGPEILARDYALLLFSQSPVIKDSELDILGSQKSTGKAVLREIAVERSSCKDWKFRESTDVSFLKLYPDVVDQQKKLWQAREQQILEIFAKRGRGTNLKGSSRSGQTTRSEEGSVRTTAGASSGSSSMSKETQEALPKILRKLFQTQKVCSFQAICQGLRGMAVSTRALPKANPGIAATAVAAAKGVDAPQEELHGFISKVAVNVHGVYLLKESSEQPELNPLRDVVIQSFIGRGPNAKLKKGEIIEAAKIKLNKVPTNTEFQKVINEYCVSKGGAWVLKSGDGVPK